jgi:hypothetical protein
MSERNRQARNWRPRHTPTLPVMPNDDCCFFASPDNFEKTWYFCNDHGRLVSDCGDRWVAMRAG